MQTEIEAKFLNIDHDEIRTKLKQIGAVCEQPMRLMQRQMFDYPDGRFKNNTYPERLRVRDEGDKVTMTYKLDRKDDKYSQETEIIVDSFDTAVNLLESIGFVRESLMESKRETWKLGNVEIVLDEWPWLESYLEIEGDTEVSIKNTAEKLGFNWGNAVFGAVDTVYRKQYPGMKKNESINDVGEVRFDRELPKYFLDRQKA